MEWRRGLAVMILATGVGGSAGAAAIFTYDTPGELFGASLVAPAGLREFVRRSADYCGAAFPELKGDGQEAFVDWVRRHAGFLTVVAELRSHGLAAPDPEKRAQWKQVIEEYVPKQIDSLAGALVRTIEEIPVPEAKQAMCRNITAAINARKFDLELHDPPIATYLRELAAKQPGESAATPPRSALAPPPSPQSRTDVAALYGRWKVTKSIFYLFNGTARENTGTCSVEFSERRLASECQTSGRNLRVVYAYRLLAPGRYEAEIVEHITPQLIGARSQVVFRVDRDTLFTTAYPPTTAVMAETAPIKVETVSTRDGATAKPSR
jgi:hypothetical protein